MIPLMPVCFDPDRWIERLHLAPLLVGLCLFVSSCDPSVTVLDPSENLQFSLFGTLDVAADTQAIRVEPLGDGVQLGSPRTFPGRLRLENLDTGTQVALRDSVVTIGDHTRVHNFWTTHPIRPRTEYRVSVRVDGEVVTSATARTPDTTMSVGYGEGLQLPCGRGDQVVLRFEKTERVAAVHVAYPITLTRGSGADAPVYDSTRIRYDHLEKTRNPFTVPLDYGDDLTAINDEEGFGPRASGCIPQDRFFHDYVSVTVADGGAGWPDWLGTPLNEVARPDSFSNVQGGHGFVGGIYSDTIQVPIQSRGPR